MCYRGTRRRAWVAGIVALGLAAPVTFAGAALAAPSEPSASKSSRWESSGSERSAGERAAGEGEAWVTEYEQKGDLRGSSLLFTGPDDGWLIGVDSTDNSVYLPFVTRWDGKQWTAVDPAELSELRENSLTPTSAAAFGPDDVWATGRSGWIPGKSYGLAHWDGKSWSYSEGPKIGADQVVDTAVLERLGDQIWLTSSAAPSDGPGSVGDTSVDRLVDGTWERLELPDELAKGTKAYDITGTGPDDVHVAAAAEKDGKRVPIHAYFDGTSWTVDELPIPKEWADTGWYPEVMAATSDQVYYWGRAQDDVHQRLYRSSDNGATWKQVEMPFRGVTDATVHPQTGELLVPVYVMDPDRPGPADEIASFDGKEWTRYPQPTEISTPSTAFSSAYVPGTDRMVASVLLANTQADPDRAKLYITTNKPVN